MESTPIAEIVSDLHRELRQYNKIPICQHLAIGRAFHRAAIMSLITLDLPTQILDVYATTLNDPTSFKKQTQQLLTQEHQLQATQKREEVS